MSTKNVFVFAALLAISNPAKAEPTIVCGSATVTLPNRFSVVKKQTGDCPGLLITVHDRVLGRDFELKLGDDFTSRSLQLSPDDLKDLEYFQREPGSWLGYQFVVLRRREMRQDKEGEKQQVELLAFDEKLRHYADRRITLDLDDGVKVNYGKFGALLAEVKTVHGQKAEGA